MNCPKCNHDLDYECIAEETGSYDTFYCRGCKSWFRRDYVPSELSEFEASKEIVEVKDKFDEAIKKAEEKK